MKSSIPAKICVILAATIMVFVGCSSDSAPEGARTIAVVERGNLAVKITSDGNIEMPYAVNLYFDTTMFSPPYSGKITGVYVEKGDMVKAGTLLAKIDDTVQKLSVESSQYALELAINNVVQTACCLSRSPSFYSDAVALTRYEFAVKEMEKAQILLQAGNYVDAAAQLSLARMDIAATWDIYNDPEYRNLRTEFSDSGMVINSNGDVTNGMERLSSEIASISTIQQQLKEGSYYNAGADIQTLRIHMEDTQSVVKRLNHLPGDAKVADAATAFTVVREAMTALDELEALEKQENYDSVKYAETLSIIRHDLELSNKILDENVSTYRQGLNLKATRDYNIAIQTALINLERAKQVLLNTEIYAPFDGEIVDVNLHTGDMITQRYSAAGVPIDTYVIRMADTGSVKFTGMVDEIDVVKMSGIPLDKLKATVLVDAYPGKAFKGNVKFISSYGAQQSNSIQYYGTSQPLFATYKMEIAIAPEDAVYLTGGLSATAEIEVDNLADVLLVPNGALIGEAGNYTVKVLNGEEKGTVELRQVTIGAQSRSLTEITSGLTEGEKILIEKPVYPQKLQTTIE